MEVTYLCGEKVILLDLTWQNILQIPCTTVSEMDTLPLSQYSKPTQITVCYSPPDPFARFQLDTVKMCGRHLKPFTAQVERGAKGQSLKGEMNWSQWKLPTLPAHLWTSIWSPLSLFLPFGLNWCLTVTKISLCLSHKAIVPNTGLFTPRRHLNYSNKVVVQYREVHNTTIMIMI